MRFVLWTLAILVACSTIAVAQTVEDASGNGRVGELMGGIPPSVIDDGSGPTGTPYFEFGGSPVVSTEVPADWGLNGSYTMSLWFEAYDIASLNTNAVLAGSYADGSVPGFGIFFNGAKGLVNQISAYHVLQTDPFEYNVVQDWQNLSSGWHHVGLVFEDGVGSSLYLDGVLADADSTYTGGISEYGVRFAVGGQDYTATRPFAGGIDDTILYDRALTPTEIGDIYAGSPPTGAALHWEFNEIDLPDADVPDLSGNGHDGFYTNEGTTSVNDGTGPYGGYLMPDGTGFINSGWAPEELTGSYTVAAWFQGHDAAETNEVLFGSYADGAVPGFVLQFVGDPRHGDDQLLAFHVSTTDPFTYASVQSPESYADGWHQAVLVFEESVGLRLYVDGAKVGEDTSVTDGISAFPVGFSAGGQNFTQ